MAVVILDVNSTTWSLDGIEYLKNFMTVVSGDKLTLLNVYDSKLILVKKTNYTEWTLGGGGFASAALLQAALKDVLYSRNSIVPTNETGYHIIETI